MVICQQAAETRKPEFHDGYNVLVLQQLQRLSTKLRLLLHD